jgi:hypothetical protein
VSCRSRKSCLEPGVVAPGVQPERSGCFGSLTLLGSIPSFSTVCSLQTSSVVRSDLSAPLARCAHVSKSAWRGCMHTSAFLTDSDTDSNCFSVCAARTKAGSQFQPRCSDHPNGSSSSASRCCSTGAALIGGLPAAVLRLETTVKRPHVRGPASGVCAIKKEPRRVVRRSR